MCFLRCAPCKQIAPKFVSLSEQYPSVLFWKVDVDICRVSRSNGTYCSSSTHPATLSTSEHSNAV